MIATILYGILVGGLAMVPGMLLVIALDQYESRH